MDRGEVMRWVAGYERAWREGDLAAVAGLFTEDARYRPSPYEDAAVGHAAIGAFWLDDEGEVFTVRTGRRPPSTPGPPLIPAVLPRNCAVVGAQSPPRRQVRPAR